MNSQTNLTEEHEVDGMVCRACGNHERASEGFECKGCRRFLCLDCTLGGVTLCTDCEPA